MQDNNKFQVLGTKVSPEAWTRLNILARKRGMTIYELVQMVCDTLLRYMDDRHNLTPEMEKAMAIFDHMEGWTKAFNLTDPTVQREVGEAIYFFQEPKGKRKGVRAVHVTKPFMNQGRSESANVQYILEHTIELLMPERYRRLRALAVDKDCNSLLELLDMLIDLHSQDNDLTELRQQFEDCNRSDFGKAITYGQRTRRVKHHDVDEMRGLFSDDDFPTIEGSTIDDVGVLGKQ